jgi:alpha-N-acetylglucosaminidase
MKPSFLKITVLLLLILNISARTPYPRPAAYRELDEQTSIEAAHMLLKRQIGDHAEGFTLTIIPKENNRDVYQISAFNGKVEIKGSSPSALCRGAYVYLKEACNSMITWGGKHLNIPETLPDHGPKRQVSPYRFRLRDNVCVFGYSSVYWDWERWEQELDWMALHGYNMQFAPVAAEALWSRVWKRFGVTDDELKEFFTGPAYLPWHRMGNLYGWSTTLTRHWHQKRISLQKKILGRMNALGITPIAPAFAGFIPRGFKRAHPDARTLPVMPWAGFSEKNAAVILHPLSPWYAKIGKAFIEEWKKEFSRYGDTHYYLADSFNENHVPVSSAKEKRYEELAAFGEAVYRAVTAGDSDGIWVMQGWLFNYSRDFWDKPSTKALLSNIPNDRMIILDLCNELMEGWKKHDAYYGKQWFYSLIPNFGGNTPLAGHMGFYAKHPAGVLQNTQKGNLSGFAVSAEGIENNEIIFELLSDISWSGETVDIKKWLDGYIKSRYGDSTDKTSVENLHRAWEILLAAGYNDYNTNIRHFLQSRPVIPSAANKEMSLSKELKQGVTLLLSCSEQFKDNVLYRNDAIEWAAQYLGIAVDKKLVSAIATYFSGDRKTSREDSNQALRMMLEIDSLMENHTYMNLKRWEFYARLWGDSEEEKQNYVADARRLITTWGSEELSDYGARLWSGLIRDYYYKRWRKFFTNLRKARPFNIREWEAHWIEKIPLSPPPPKLVDPLKHALKLIQEVDTWFEQD